MKQVRFPALFVLFIVSSIIMSACTIPALGVERSRKGSPLFDIRLSENGVDKIYAYKGFVPVRGKAFYFTALADQPHGNGAGVWNLSRVNYRINNGRYTKLKLGYKSRDRINLTRIRSPRDNSERLLTLAAWWQRTYIIIDEHGIPETHTENFGPVYQVYTLKFYR